MGKIRNVLNQMEEYNLLTGVESQLPFPSGGKQSSTIGKNYSKGSGDINIKDAKSELPTSSVSKSNATVGRKNSKGSGDINLKGVESKLPSLKGTKEQSSVVKSKEGKGETGYNFYDDISQSPSF